MFKELTIKIMNWWYLLIHLQGYFITFVEVCDFQMWISGHLVN